METPKFDDLPRLVMELNHKIDLLLARSNGGQVENKPEDPNPDNAHIHGWLCEKEAQRMLGLKTTVLWKLRTTGQLVFSKIGNKTYYKVASIQALLESQSQ